MDKKDILTKNIREHLGDNPTATEVVDYCYSENVITEKSLRNYSIVKTIENRPEGQSPRSAMIDLDLDGCDGAADGLGFDAIKKVYELNR